MPNVIMQPCGDERAFKHFKRTISNDISIRDIKKFVTGTDWKKMKEIYPDETCRIWGVQPKLGGNIRKWEKIVPGDFAYFARKKKFIASGKVTIRLHNRDLSLFLWGTGNKESTWEYIYFLS